jgi:hypothetical protein
MDKVTAIELKALVEMVMKAFLTSLGWLAS